MIDEKTKISRDTNIKWYSVQGNVGGHMCFEWSFYKGIKEK